MMKAIRAKIYRAALVGLFAMLLALAGIIPQAFMDVDTAGAVFAEEDDESSEEGSKTTYTVFIYSGKEGSFGGETVKKITGLEYNEKVTVSAADLNLKVKDPDKYYVRGLKLAGHDNDELSSVQLQSYSFDIKEDMSFSVAYGMTGGMVKYTVNYVDKNGKKLHKSESFYGMPGDKPVVAYRHVEGYLPDAYNLAKTLSTEESANVFTFKYHKVYAESDSEEGSGNGGSGNGRGSGSGQNAGVNAANGQGGYYTTGNGAYRAESLEDDDESADDDAINGANITDLDDSDNATPLTDGSQSKEESKAMFSTFKKVVIGIVAAGVLLAIALVVYLLKRGDRNED